MFDHTAIMISKSSYGNEQYCVARNICVSSHYYHQKKKIKTKQNQQKYIIQNKEISYVSCVEKKQKPQT